MNYSSSITDFFKSPKWLPSLLLGAVCILIPIVGPLVLMGWHTAAMFGKREPVDFRVYPPFDFNDFGTHLGRGVWPFLVNLVIGIVLVPVIWVSAMVPVGAAIALGSTQTGKPADGLEGLPFILSITVVFVVVVALGLAMSFILRPMMIRAAITQDFGQAFNLQFVKDFTVRTWGDQIVCLLFQVFASCVLMIAGMFVFCVGTYASAALIVFVQWHLDRQLYDLYIARGGEPVPVSPKLAPIVPPLPQA
jgi:hypothetical protein